MEKRKWTEDEEKWLLENYHNHTVKYCAEYLGRTFCSIAGKVEWMGGMQKIIIKKWTNDDEEWLIKNYKTYGTNYCSKILNCEKKSIRAKVKLLNLRLNPKERKLLKEREFEEANNNKICLKQFENIDKDYVAYFLGFTWADGHVSKTTSAIQFGIGDKDAKTISKTLFKIGHWNIFKSKKATTTQFRIWHCQLSKFLRNHDYHLKSYVEPTKILSKIPTELHKFFWHGFLDGDGCIYVSKKYNNHSIFFCGQFDYEWGCVKNLFEKLQIKKYKIRRSVKDKIKNHRSSIIEISNKNESLVLLNYIYNNEFYKGCLKRKFDKFIEFKQKYNMN